MVLGKVISYHQYKYDCARVCEFFDNSLFSALTESAGATNSNALIIIINDNINNNNNNNNNNTNINNNDYDNNNNNNNNNNKNITLYHRMNAKYS